MFYQLLKILNRLKQSIIKVTFPIFCMIYKTILQYENLSFLLSSPPFREQMLFQNTHQDIVIATPHPDFLAIWFLWSLVFINQTLIFKLNVREWGKMQKQAKKFILSCILPVYCDIAFFRNWFWEWRIKRNKN